MAVEEYRDNKVIYHLNIDEEAKDILMYLSSLKTIKINRVIKGTTLVSAFYIFSLAFTLYLFHMSFAWIGFVLSIGFAAFGLSVEELKKTFIKASINKKEQKMSSERKYLFSKDGVEIVSEIGITHNYWSSFVSKGEIENYIYLIRKDNKVLLINKSVLSENELMMLGSFIQEIETEPIEPGNKMSFIMKILVAATMITAIVSLIYMGIKIGYPLSDGEIFRLWFIRTVPIILLLILQCLNVMWTCVLSGIIKMNKKKSLLKRILLWVVGIIVVLAMALGIFVNMLNDDSEHYNSNGTVIVKTPVWLDEPSYRLYKEKNILVLQFLRSADGIEDIDASITQQEYMDKKYGDLEKELEHQDENKKVKKIEEGYLKIYETYIKDTDEEYRKDYNAKGYSYIVTYEDETQIRYLMYDRDNQEGTKAQYVYYKNIKNTDGSWSMMDAEILDMYQYDYESKEVKDLQKTSW